MRVRGSERESKNKVKGEGTIVCGEDRVEKGRKTRDERPISGK